MKWLSILVWLLFWGAMLFSQSVTEPNDAFKLGTASYQAGKFEAAVKSFDDAISLDPARSYFYYNRGLALEAIGEHKKAIADFKKSNDLKVTAEAFYQLGVVAYQQGQMADAKTNLENAKQLKQDVASLNYYLGMVYFKEKKYSEGYKCFVDYTEHHPAASEAFYYRGFCEAEIGKLQEAVSSLKQATAFSTNNAKYFLKLYSVYKTLNDNENALVNITMVIETGGRKAQYYVDRANLYKAMGKDFLYESDMRMADQLKSTASADDDDDE